MGATSGGRVIGRQANPGFSIVPCWSITLCVGSVAMRDDCHWAMGRGSRPVAKFLSFLDPFHYFYRDLRCSCRENAGLVGMLAPHRGAALGKRT